MEQLRSVCREAISENKASFIIGYTEDKHHHLKPYIAHNVEETEKLTFNCNAVNNLAVFIHRSIILAKGRLVSF